MFRPLIRSVPLRTIRITDPFWRSRQETVANTTLLHEWMQIEATGRLENFLKAGGKLDGEFLGRYPFDDSDVYKWLEACGYALLLGPNPRLQGPIDRAIGAISAAQEPSGYLNTFFQLKHPELKWRNLVSMHEMYCAGHLIEAAVALHECASDDRLLKVAVGFADHIASVFGPGKRSGYPGHEELELALLRLSATTSNRSYADLAHWMVSQRGSRPSPFEAEIEDPEAMAISPYSRRMMFREGKYSGEYEQDHAPVVDHTHVVGHAVRAMYLYAAATEVAAMTGDQKLAKAMVRVWENLTRRRMYITGGIGPSGENEGFTADFDLPNLTAYAETCAACGLVFWGRQLLHATGDAEYAAIIERALYNGALAGISLSGDRFFYANPLESRGTHERVPWFECACCPPNIARLIASVGSYIVGVSEDSFWVHIPAGFEAEFESQGIKTRIELEGEYPWSSEFKLTVDPQRPVEFAVRIRIPDWAESVEIDVPGLDRESEYVDGYAVISKQWTQGDTISVKLAMEPQWIQADPRVRDDLGRIAMTRGPLVYCAEGCDNGFSPHLFMAGNGYRLRNDSKAGLGQVSVIEVEGSVESGNADELYSPVRACDLEPAALTMIPYFAWNNRGPGDMAVWLRRL